MKWVIIDIGVIGYYWFVLVGECFMYYVGCLDIRLIDV